MMKIVLFGLLALALAVAADDRVTVSHTCDDPESCPLTLNEGLDETLTLKLDEPIICASQSEACYVIVHITNSHPQDVELDRCSVTWLAHEWFHEKTVRIRAPPRFTANKAKKVTLVFEKVESTAEYYKDYKPNNLILKTAPRSPGYCHATGDPHYTTFDGFYWHFYGEDNDLPTMFVQSKARNYMVQTRMHTRTGAPGVQCAIAVRENEDVVIVDVCSGTMKLETRITSPAGKGARLLVSGNEYQVKLPSGAWVKAHVHRWSLRPYYMNVYTGVPGEDYGNVVGMCGTWDGNRNNDVIKRGQSSSIGYNTWIRRFSELNDDMSVTGSENVWNYFPTGVTTEEPLPASAERCTFEIPKLPTPVLENPDAEDLTDTLKDLQDSLKNNPQNYDGLDLGGDAATRPPITDAQADKLCRDAFAASATLTVCKEKLSEDEFDYEGALTNCFEDAKATGGNPDFVEGAILAAARVCAEAASANELFTDENGNVIPELANPLCKTLVCSGHGDCVDGACVCDTGYLGNDCSVDATQPATVLSLDRKSCDSKGRDGLGCPSMLSVTGLNFLRSSALTCRFETPDGNVDKKGVWASSSLVLCPMVGVAHSGATEVKVPIEISNDGVTFSNNDVSVTFYDSACQVCDHTGSCGDNPESCTIGETNPTCYLAGTRRPGSGNECQFCKPAESTSSWTFDFTNAHLCGPVFEQDPYSRIVHDEIAAGGELITVKASNPRTTDDIHKITYTLDHQGVAALDGFFVIDSNTGKITVAPGKTLSFEALGGDPTGLFSFTANLAVTATDHAGNTDTTSVTLDVVPVNGAPLFPERKYEFEVEENAAKGTFVGQVQAEDPETKDDSTLSYSWMAQEVNYGDTFAVDESGRITVNKPENLDFEKKAMLLNQLRARDEAGSGDIVEVTFKLTNVNEAPTSISLSSNTVPENAAGAVVGTLSGTDPEDDALTFSLKSGAGFEVVGNELKATADFDFENVAEKTHTVVIEASDPALLKTEATFTVTVTDVNEAPKNIRLVASTAGINPLELSEEIGLNTQVGKFEADDDDSNQKYSCSLADSADGTFVVVQNRLVVQKSLDFETAPKVTIAVACADEPVDASAQPDFDSKTSAVQTFEITVLDVNEAPKELTLAQNPATIPENGGPGGVGTVTAVDYDGEFPGSTINFSIAPEDAATFGIVDGSKSCEAATPQGVQCSVQIAAVGDLNYETETPGKTVVHIIVGDDQSPPRQATLTVDVVVSDLPEDPTDVTLSVGTIFELPEQGEVLGELTIVDDDAENTFTVGVTDAAGAFGVREKTSGGARRSASKVYELYAAQPSEITADKASMAFSVSVGDAATGNTKSFSKSVTVVPRPVAIKETTTSSMPEGAGAGTTVSEIELENFDESKFTPKFTLENDHNGAFEVVETPAGSGKAEVRVKDPTKLDFEGDSTVELTVKVEFESKGDDVAPGPLQKELTLELTNVDEAPQFESGYSVNVEFRATEGTTVLTGVKATDPEGQTVSYSLSQNVLGGLFKIVSVAGGEAQLQLARDVEDGYYMEPMSVTIAATSSSGTTETTVAVSIENACAKATCQNSGTCQVCKISGLTVPAGLETVSCSAARQQQTGFECACPVGFLPPTCAQKEAGSTFTVKIPLGDLPSDASIAESELEAIEQNVFDKLKTLLPDAGLEREDIETLFESHPTDADKKTLSLMFETETPLTPDQLAQTKGFDVGFTYEDGSGTSVPTVMTTDVGFTYEDGSGTSVPTVMTTDEATAEKRTEGGSGASTSSSSSGGIASGALVGIIVAVILLLVLVALVAMYVVRQRNQHVELPVHGSDAGAVAANPMFAAKSEQPAYESLNIANNFENGISNQMYGWYQPELGRSEVNEILEGGAEGAFVLRDSPATPGWHMLCVRHNNQVLHEKIRQNPDSTYELLPSTTPKKQPAFPDLPSLVEHYASRTDVGFQLALDNPLYDSHLLAGDKNYQSTGGAIRRDMAAPMVPLKERQVDTVVAVAGGSEDIYTNAEEARAALDERHGSTSTRQ
jgi:hypothetical protein